MTDFLAGRESWRRLRVLLEQLPADSAFVRARIGPAAAWPIEAHLLAHIADLTAWGNHQRGYKRGNAPPKRIPRPGASSDGERQFGGRPGTYRTPAEFHAAYQQMLDRAKFEEVSVDGR